MGTMMDLFSPRWLWDTLKSSCGEKKTNRRKRKKKKRRKINKKKEKKSQPAFMQIDGRTGSMTSHEKYVFS